MSDEGLEDLVGAYALDACTPTEAAALERLLADNATLAAELATLRRAAAEIGALAEAAPPSLLRSRVLRAARSMGNGPAANGASAHEPVDPLVACYEALAGALVEVAAWLPDDALARRTPNGLTARDLVVHCAAQESLLAQLHGHATIDDIDETDVEARTAALLRLVGDGSVLDALGLLRDAVAANRAWAADPGAVDDVVSWLGAPMPRHEAMVIRAFECWIHADDLRGAAGRAPTVPAPEQLALMSDVAGRFAGQMVALSGRGRDGATARLVLTGPGGGEWTVGLDGLEPGPVPHVTLTADVVDWCRLVGERLSPDELALEVVGDPTLADAVVRSATALATL